MTASSPLRPAELTAGRMAALAADILVAVAAGCSSPGANAGRTFGPALGSGAPDAAPSAATARDAAGTTSVDGTFNGRAVSLESAA